MSTRVTPAAHLMPQVIVGNYIIPQNGISFENLPPELFVAWVSNQVELSPEPAQLLNALLDGAVVDNTGGTPGDGFQPCANQAATDGNFALNTIFLNLLRESHQQLAREVIRLRAEVASLQ